MIKGVSGKYSCVCLLNSINLATYCYLSSSFPFLAFKWASANITSLDLSSVDRNYPYTNTWEDSLSNRDIFLNSQRYLSLFQNIADPEIPLGFIPRKPLYPLSSIQSLIWSYLSTSLRPMKSGSTSWICCCIIFHLYFQSKNFAGTLSKFYVSLSASIFQCMILTPEFLLGIFLDPSARVFLTQGL